MNAKAVATHLSHLLRGLLLLLTLGVFATPSAAEPLAPPSPAPHLAGSPAHAPQILRVVEREDVEDGVRYFYKDIYFRDTGGDATVLANRIAATDPEGGIALHITDDAISAPASQQMQEAAVSTRYGCPSRSVDPLAFTVENRVVDASGNVSEPVSFTISCPATVPADMRPLSIAGWVMGAVLLLAAGLYIALRRSQARPLLLSTLLFLFSLMTVSFVQFILHEGGHALMDLRHLAGQRMVLYVHPFTFAGYSRPMFAWNDTLAHAGGAVVALLAALLITLPFWKRRSLLLLPLVMMFPWSALNNGGYMASVEGDFHNIMQITGLPPVVFIVVGALIALAGVVLLFALLPLMGLAPNDAKALIAIPAGMFVWGVLSRLVAVLLVPGSPFATRWHLTGEILMSSQGYVAGAAIALVASALYITLYRRLAPRLPAWLRSEPVALAWSDLRLPALLWTLSLGIGLLVVTL